MKARLNEQRPSMYVRYIPTLVFACLLAVSVGGELGAAEQGRRNEQRLVADPTVDKAVEARAPQIARVVRRLKPKAGATAVAWSPDGKLLATAGGLRQWITAWDSRTGEMIWEQVGDFGGGEAVAFSSDGRLLLAPTAKGGPEDQHSTLTLWDVATGTIAGRVAGPFPDEGIVANFARKIALDRQDGIMALIAMHQPGRPVALYDMRDWSLKGTVVVEKDTPEGLAFAPGGTLAVGTVGGKIAFFDALTRMAKHTMYVRGFEALAYSPDGKYIAIGSSSSPDPIQIWSAPDGTLLRSYAGEFGCIKGLAWSPDRRYLASASYDHTIRLWHVTTDGPGQVVATLKGAAWSVAFSADGRFLAGGSNEDDAIIAEVN